jgi:hypothetical protein
VDVVRRTDLRRLALGRRGPCVSVFLPTHRAGPEVQQGPIRLKNLLRQATEVLKSDGVRAPEIDRLLAPLRGLLDDRLFWQYQSQRRLGPVQPARVVALLPRSPGPSRAGGGG